MAAHPNAQTSPRSRAARRALTSPLLLSLCVLAACTGKDQPAGPPGGAPQAMPVTVLEVQPTKVESSVEAVAQTEGAREVEIRARVGGILTKRLYEEGAPVKAGQPLFQLDREPFDVAVAQAKAQVAQNKARAEQTVREAARLKSLLAQQAISQREYDTAASDNSAALAAVQAAEAALRQAELNLTWSTVTAPVAGVSGRAAISEGNLVSTNGLVTTVTQLNPMWVRFSLSEAELNAATPSGRFKPQAVRGVELILPDGSTYPVRGKLNFAASQVNPALGTLQLRGEFPNADGALLPGQFVRARLLTGERDGVFKVPQNAVMQTDKGAVVMLANADNKVEPRPVKTGQWVGTEWVILGGLKAGDKVIVDNLIKVRPGAPVAPHGPGEGPGAPGGKPAAAPAAPAKG